MSPLDRYRQANLANWNERVIGHTAPDGYDIAGLISNPEQLTEVVQFDAQVLGDVKGKTLLHSQCHVGTDTLSWAKLGAAVTGLDFSPDALASARDTAQKLQATGAPIDATFVECEFYDAPAHIDQQFDIVYTSVGAINWLPDIDRWAKILAGFLRPGGTFYIRDSHPMLMSLDDERDDTELVVTYNYFHTAEPQSFPDTESYSGSATLENPVSYEWCHTIADVVNALISAGLRIERLEELQHLDWQFLSHMEEIDGLHVLPESQRLKLPMQFSVLATKPAADGQS